MAKQVNRHTFSVEGMTCAGCERRIARALGNMPGVTSVEARYQDGTVTLVCGDDAFDRAAIEKALRDLDYRVVSASDARSGSAIALQAAGALIVLFALFMLLRHFGALNIFNAFPTAQAGMSLGAMFVIGLLTSLHCVAMCGGINLSQCVGSASCADAGKRNTLRASLLYNLGRVLSYTAIGAVVGAIGSVVSFSGAAKGVVQLVAGIFMVIMGLNLLGIFPWLRKIAPRMPKIFARRLGAQGQGNGPLYVGLLNGLMPCGPLQAMQLYALSTGSAGMGAMSMLLFSLGTVPLMFGFGALSSLLNKKFTKRMMLVSAALVIVLGVSMFHNGIALSGFGAPVARAAAQPAEASTAPAEVQKITSQMSPNGYDPITVQAGVPVEWTLQAEAGDINGCNNEIVIPSLNISKKLQPGDNVIEFTPAQSGTIPFSCWMGMIRSSITVAEADAALPTAQAAEPLTAFFGPPAPTSATGGLPSCCQ